ncbi:transcription repressor OFP8-like [Asparagus officinalis]|uniref:transcription repressor OFP8-like n=1 Tax=Asparagus officinalis TaxID=4686 RepID=UPI00098E7193|nr:transcription repressor OFP8-like [Asparagus officinalis]
MSSTRRKFHVRQPAIVDIGCNCRKPKLSYFFPKQRKTHTNYPSIFSPSTESITTTTNTSSSFSPSNVTSPPSQAFLSPKQSKRKKGVVEDSVAVEKESSDPYLDFRDSMLQMIVEKEIYSWDDLKELLHLFLSLNSPRHHPQILQAFAEIWNGVFSPGS